MVALKDDEAGRGLGLVDLESWQRDADHKWETPRQRVTEGPSVLPVSAAEGRT